jgi:hypothetical protein
MPGDTSSILYRLRRVQDSNLCESFCRASYNHSNNPPLCSPIRIRTQTPKSVASCANPLHHRTICTGGRNRTLSQRFWRPLCYRYTTPVCVGIVGIEPTTFRVSGECSNQLSYIPIGGGCMLITYLTDFHRAYGRNSRIRTCVLHIPNVAR